MPTILAHRGASGHITENSRAAFREAIRLGAAGVELDVHASADGGLFVHHDAEIPGHGSIPSLSTKALQGVRLSNGEPLPALAEVLELLSGHDVWIELKSLPPSADAALLDAITNSPTPERCAVHSFDHRIVARVGSARPELRRGILSTSYPLDPVAPLRAAGANTLWQEWHLIDTELVTAVHRTGATIIAWTVNVTRLGERLAELGVDGLCGDFPERLVGLAALRHTP